MDLKDIKELKDKVYELEGLLELAQLREDKIPELEPLIQARLRGLSGVEMEDVTVAQEPEKQTVIIREEIGDIEPDPIPANDDIVGKKSDSLFDESEFVPVIGKEQDKAFVTEMPDAIESTQSDILTEKPSVGTHTSYTLNDQLTPGEFSGARKPAFCLNDRFRFRRELFGNSDAEFSAAMNNIATMENYEEAEEYFLGELGWNPENEDVADFLAIIAQYFEKQ